MVHKMEWYVGTEWRLDHKGLRKKVLVLEFTKVEKPNQVAKVVINVGKVINLKARETQWLSQNTLNTEQTMEMGTALTPVDCYLEMLVQQMMVGETAECYIKTKTPGEDIIITLTLQNIEETKGIQTLSVAEMYNLALKYKENGVRMFKKYQIFAHEYFLKAAKCLISYKNFEGYTEKSDGVSEKDLKDLFMQIQTNLAACLLNEKRYDDVIYHTNFVETMNSCSEKSIYRRAMAYYHMHEYELAKKAIEKVVDYKEKKEFSNLHQKVSESWKNSNAQYKGMVQKMFG